MAHLLLIFMLSLLIIACSSKLVLGHSVVETLPGFEGPLPFELETGYVGVDKLEDVQLFYYFVKSESNPKEDPLVLWLTGGPGCSAFSGFVYEIEVASVIFIDLPVGTGFSYGMTSLASQSSDLQSCDQAYEFLKKWLIDHPNFLSNPVYVGGESYTGITIPIIVQVISNGIIKTGLQSGPEGPCKEGMKEGAQGGDLDSSLGPPKNIGLALIRHSGNEAGIKPLINLKGYLLGNPVTTPDDSNYAIPFAHGMGLISDELYERRRPYVNSIFLVIAKKLSRRVFEYRSQQYTVFAGSSGLLSCIDGVLNSQILEPSCGFASPKPQELFSERRYVDEKNIELVVRQSSPCDSSRGSMHTNCPIFGITMIEFEKRSISERGSIKGWMRCNKLSYTRTICDSFQYHVNLSTKGYRSLIYSGDHDMMVPFLGTQAWIRALNYSIVDEWRSWWVQGQVAGYTRTYSNWMTFATVKGEEDIQLRSKSLLNVILCLKDGFLINLYDISIFYLPK
ncbi:unnamed protein product [Camellia sinensis]